MKKVFLIGLVAMLACGGAMASDGGLYVETYTESTVSYDTTVRYASSQDIARPAVRRNTCGCRSCGCAAPVRVKTYSEVIDHYQVYKPVTVYQPAGTYTQRRIIEAPRCDNCGM